MTDPIEQIEQFRPGDLEQRLKPFRRLLDDLSSAAVVADHLGELNLRVEEKRQELQGLGDEGEQRRATVTAEIAALEADLTGRRAAARDELDHLAAETKRAQERASQAEVLAREAEARRDELQRELAAMRARFA